MVVIVDIGDTKTVTFSASLGQNKGHFRAGWHNWLQKLQTYLGDSPTDNPK
jgi:hypothetical protein